MKLDDHRGPRSGESMDPPFIGLQGSPQLQAVTNSPVWAVLVAGNDGNRDRDRSVVNGRCLSPDGCQ